MNQQLQKKATKMKSPKCNCELQPSILNDVISVQYCPESQGFWISSIDYEGWLRILPNWYGEEVTLPHQYMFEDFKPSAYDSKAGLCPECGFYLSRAKINIKRPFYVERCMNCGGIWFDNGEWEILEQLGLHTRIKEIFSTRWQTQVRHNQHEVTARVSLMEQLGEEIADYIFQLADILEDHPHGDAAATYLFRRWEKKRKKFPAKNPLKPEIDN
ncbi:MAG: zf-TFIIB domain-containing protein [Cyanobacteriota bacterium]|nr:zf-TFIIB domain-containing protein [Cyanobacteriota bacterium]